MAGKSRIPATGAISQAAPEIVFLSSSDPLDIRSFSTVLFHMVSGLREQFPDMEIVRNSRPRLFGRFQSLVRKISGGRADPYYWPVLNRWFAARFARRWRRRRVVVIAVVNSTLVAELARRVPVINVSDATFALMRNFYETFERLDDATARAGDRAERLSITRSVHNCFSSAWAAQSAIQDYGADPQDVSAVPWGCNLPSVERARARLEDEAGGCRLLFIGGDWRRKGGDLVLETERLLHARGLPVSLDLVGATPAGGLADTPAITVHGFLSKAVEADFARLMELYRNASFLFLPTRQDCTPMVFSEANAFGTPALTRDVGGVGGVVEDGVNGYLLAQEATPQDFADRIERSLADPKGYGELRRSSRRTYETRLNWSAWARSMRGIVDDLAAAGRI